MSWRQYSTRTRALREASRRNARLSTDPCIRRGKAQSGLSGLKTAGRSRLDLELQTGGEGREKRC